MLGVDPEWANGFDRFLSVVQRPDANGLRFYGNKRTTLCIEDAFVDFVSKRVSQVIPGSHTSSR